MFEIQCTHRFNPMKLISLLSSLIHYHIIKNVNMIVYLMPMKLALIRMVYFL